jgi:hypothetical protein
MTADYNPTEATGGSHVIDGEFQSDKYPTTPRGKVPLSVKDPTAQDLLWQYAQRRRGVDAEFAADLEACLRAAGYTPPAPHNPTEAQRLIAEAREAAATGPHASIDRRSLRAIADQLEAAQRERDEALGDGVLSCRPGETGRLQRPRMSTPVTASLGSSGNTRSPWSATPCASSSTAELAGRNRDHAVDRDIAVRHAREDAQLARQERDQAQQRIAELEADRAHAAQAYEARGRRVNELEDAANRAESERDAYRSMVCDLLSSARMFGLHPLGPAGMTRQWDRARELLKNGAPAADAKPSQDATSKP